MIKNLLKYILVGGLLYGGHYFFSETFLNKGLSNKRESAHLMLFLLFTISHLLTEFLGRRFSLIPGQVFLIFSVVKLISAGLFMFVIKQISGLDISKSFTLAFMFSYFIYLILDISIVLKFLKSN